MLRIYISNSAEIRDPPDLELRSETSNLKFYLNGLYVRHELCVTKAKLETAVERHFSEFENNITLKYNESSAAKPELDFWVDEILDHYYYKPLSPEGLEKRKFAIAECINNNSKFQCSNCVDDFTENRKSQRLPAEPLQHTHVWMLASCFQYSRCRVKRNGSNKDKAASFKVCDISVLLNIVINCRLFKKSWQKVAERVLRYRNELHGHLYDTDEVDDEVLAVIKEDIKGLQSYVDSYNSQFDVG